MVEMKLSEAARSLLGTEQESLSQMFAREILTAFYLAMIFGIVVSVFLIIK